MGVISSNKWSVAIKALLVLAGGLLILLVVRYLTNKSPAPEAKKIGPDNEAQSTDNSPKTVITETNKVPASPSLPPQSTIQVNKAQDRPMIPLAEVIRPSIQSVDSFITQTNVSGHGGIIAGEDDPCVDEPDYQHQYVESYVDRGVGEEKFKYNTVVIGELIEKLNYGMNNYPPVPDREDKMARIANIAQAMQSFLPPSEEGKIYCSPGAQEIAKTHAQCWRLLVEEKYEYIKLYSLGVVSDVNLINSQMDALNCTHDMSELYALLCELEQRLNSTVKLARELKNDRFEIHYKENLMKIEDIDKIPLSNKASIEAKLTSLRQLYPSSDDDEDNQKKEYYPFIFLIAEISNVTNLSSEAQVSGHNYLEHKYINLLFNVIRILQVRNRLHSIIEYDRDQPWQLNNIKYKYRVCEVEGTVLTLSPKKIDPNNYGFKTNGSCQGSELSKMLSLIYEIHCKKAEGQNLSQALTWVIQEYKAESAQNKPKKKFLIYVRTILTTEQTFSCASIAEFFIPRDLLNGMIEGTQRRIQSYDPTTLYSASRDGNLTTLEQPFH